MKKMVESLTFSCSGGFLEDSSSLMFSRQAGNGELGKRAQGWGFDLMVAMVIFFGGIMFFYFFLVNAPGRVSGDYVVLEGEGKVISDNLMSSGFPEDWDSSNVIRIGIVDNDRINQTKLERFYSLDYNRTKLLFNIKNDYYINFSGSVSVLGSEIGVIGLQPTSSENLAKTTRLVIYNSSIRNMGVFVWD